MAGDVSHNSVSLLLHCDGVNNSVYFPDSSLNDVGVSASGNAKISTAQSRFGGASAVFDGTNSLLSARDSELWNFGSGDFTVEFSVYLPTLPSSGAYLGPVGQWSGGGNSSWSLFIANVSGTHKIQFSWSTDGTNQTNHLVDWTPSAATWMQIAVCRSGSSIRTFVNGVQVGSTTTLTATFFNSTNPLTIGATSNSNNGSAFLYYLNGYIDELRITKGVARYTANYTVATAAFPNSVGEVSGSVVDAAASPASRKIRVYRRDTGALIAETTSSDGATPTPVGDSSFLSVSLLLKGEGTPGTNVILDSSPARRTVSAFGNAQLSATQSKFGASSVSFDGSGDYCTVPDNAAFQFGSGDFTVEFFARFGSIPSGAGTYRPIVCYDNISVTRGWLALLSGDVANKFFFGCRSGSTEYSVTSLAAPALNTWNHYAAVRSGSTLSLYVDGVLQGSTTIGTASVNTPNVPLLIGGLMTSGAPGQLDLNAFIDELRITKGVARYTAAFTPPNAAHPTTAPGPVLSAGNYFAPLAYAGEVNVICLDDAAGTVENDLILRTTPV